MVSSVIITQSLLIISLHIERSGNIDYLKQRTVRITEPNHQIQLLFPYNDGNIAVQSYITSLKIFYFCLTFYASLNCHTIESTNF